jgi:hypothetical protein
LHYVLPPIIAKLRSKSTVAASWLERGERIEPIASERSDAPNNALANGFVDAAT